MDELISTFNTEYWMLSLSGSFLLLSVGVIYILKAKRGRERGRWMMGALLLEYLWLVLCFTVFCRKMGELTQFQPIPFYNFGEILESRTVAVENLLNVVMFVPVGFLLSLVLRNEILDLRGAWEVILFGLGFSILIEALQWFCKCGCCEANDVINNTLGCGIGCLLSLKYSNRLKLRD